MIEERFELAIERIRQIVDEKSVPEPFRDYFIKVAEFILLVEEQSLKRKDSSYFKDSSFQELLNDNHKLYQDILEENYETSYANPTFAVEKLGEEFGQVLCFLYAEIRSIIVFIFEDKREEYLIYCELFIQIYNEFEEEELPLLATIQEIIYWFVSDYSELTVSGRIIEQINPDTSSAFEIIMNSDLLDLRYLFQYGEYISENEIQVAEFLNTLNQEEIDSMASTYTEGYRLGFVNTNKNLAKKKVVNVRYPVGFERMIRSAILNFEKMGLRPTIYRGAVLSINKKSTNRIGYTSTSANRQFDYDHKEDQALYADKKLINRKLEVIKSTYEDNKELADVHAGPAVVEIFGETPFIPKSKKENIVFSEKQQKLMVYYDSEAGQIVNSYIKGEERSFTIIAYPIPQIGPDFKEIFAETVKINTLDYKKYEAIQQKMIDALDQAEYVEVKGKNGNRTDIKVSLKPLQNPDKETKFENCVADVNIPVGEIFTSPVLRGTTGKLHVSKVFLNELEYLDLEVDFKDGMIVSYSCKNFEKVEENEKYIKDNILHHHDTLPLGEFAVGTNTTAYVVAKKYKIEDKLPILIAEKMGPHFAVGDTCYSHSEDNIVHNPDGKEIIAKENEFSEKRKENPLEAYVNCHTDITIPYNELGYLGGVSKDGTKIPVIQDGRFVLVGTEPLNEPFDL